MLRTLASALLISSFLVSLSAANNDSPRCNCEDEGFWSIERILECQRISDFFIAIAYFSIPIELLYFVSCSNFPFKWVLFEFIAFIVLCGMTHLLNFSTYYGQHTFQLMLSLTIFKVLTALVSFATAITLLTLFPMLLKVKVREFMLRKKTWDLGREVGLIKQQREAGWHVRMLTHEIRKSLDRHTILYTTLVELSKTLELHNCAIWKPNETKTGMNLIHQLRERNFSSVYNLPIPRSDPDVEAIKGSDGVTILDADSPLAAASSGGGSSEPGAVAAVRMPMLKVSNFKGGTPELVPECYAILVLVLPGEQGRSWSDQEIEIVRVVADQVAVALSHAAVLEESQHMRETLEDQNRALQQAKQDALKASQARNGFLMGMSHGLRRPMHSISGLHSLLKEHKWSDEQRLILDAMVKTSSVASTLIDDVMDTSTTKDNGKFPLEMRHFQLHSMIKEAACLAKCLCACRGYNFSIQVDKSLPNHVVGDEKRVFQVILHMVGNLLKDHNGGCLTLRVVLPESATDRAWKARRSHSSRDNTYIKFEVGIGNNHSQPENLTSTSTHYSQRRRCREVEESLSFNVCRKLVQLMQGDIWVTPNREGFDVSMTVVLGFQLRPSTIGIPQYGESSDHSYPHPLLQGVEVLLADYDDVNRAVTGKLLEKLGCIVSAVSSGHDCLGALGPAVSSFQIVLLDLHLPDLDGFEVTMRIRKFRSRSWPLIVGLNAAADENVGQRCIQIGMNGIIQKPAVLRGIADELQRVLLQANRTV